MDLILLHGALGCSRHWDAMSRKLGAEHRLFPVDFPGHGNSDAPVIPTIDGLSDFLADYIRVAGLDNPYILGYSMGGYVSLHALAHKKIKVAGLLTIATKMNWSPEIAAKEIARLNWDVMGVIREKLESEHGAHLPDLFSNTASILKSIGDKPLNQSDIETIDTPFTMSVGENDKMVSREETERTASWNRLADWALLEGQGHTLERMDTEYLYNFVKQLLNR